MLWAGFLSPLSLGPRENKITVLRPLQPLSSFARTVRCAALVCLVAALAASGCASSEPLRPSIIIVVVDTLRADHLGLYGYETHPTSPELDARAASAAVFEQAFSTAPWTLPAFGSMLTGQLPTRHAAGLRVADVREAMATTDPRDMIIRAEQRFYQLDASLPTLGTALQADGYRTGAIMNNAFLSPEFGLHRGFGSYDYDPERPDRGAAGATDLALEWLDAHDREAADAPFMLLVHYFDPHMPYAAPEPFLGRFAAPYLGDEFTLPLDDMRPLRYAIRDRTANWERYAALEQAVYDEEIAYADHELARLFEALEQRDFFDDGYVVFTSDHGEEFQEHGRVEHGHSVYHNLIHVPLLVWGPDVVPGRYDLPVSVVDLMPTLLDYAGVAPPGEFEGVSLRAALREGPATRNESIIRFDRPLFAEAILYGDEKKAIIRWPWKTLVDIEDEAELLYNLEDDPEEQRPGRGDELDEEDRDRLLGMVAEIQMKIVEAGAESTVRGATLSEETLQRLRALGYIR